MFTEVLEPEMGWNSLSWLKTFQSSQQINILQALLIMFSLISEPKEVLSVKEKNWARQMVIIPRWVNSFLSTVFQLTRPRCFLFLYAAKENKQIVLQFEADTGGN